MNRLREPKKSETIEVRLPHEVKCALMDKARAEGRSASEVIRESIDCYLARHPKEAGSMLLTLWKPVAAVGAASVAIMWAALSPAPSHANADLKSVFQMLDRNHDGVITIDEFLRDASDPAVERMHHAHLKQARGQGKVDAEHAQSMRSVHGKMTDQALRSHFAQLDANSDGSVTLEEFRAFHDRIGKSHGRH